MLIFNKVSFQDKLLFTKHLAIMLKSGLPITQTVGIIKEQTSNPEFKNILGGVLADLQNGLTLEKSLAKYPEVFDPLYLNIVSVGEESGKLEENLTYLAQELFKTHEFQKKVQSAMLYPSIVLIATVFIGGAISFFVLPQLADLFKSMDITLPLATRILLWFANTARDFGFYIAMGLILFSAFFVFLINTAAIKPYWHRFVLKVPIFGQFVQFGALATVCRNMGMMLASGLPITKALRITTETMTNLVFKDYLEHLYKTVESGKTMGAELISKKYSYIPLIFSSMVGVGEKTGTLEKSFLYLGDFFTDEIDDMAKNLPTVLEPIMLLGVAIMVAFLAFSIISPIYQFTGSIRR